MKRAALLLFVILPTICFAQKIKVNEIDKFTHKRRIETSQQVLKNGSLEELSVSYRSVDTTYFLKLFGRSWAVGFIGPPRDQLVFLLDNDETVSVPPIGAGNKRSDGYYEHEYSITKSQIQLLSEHKLKNIRRTGDNKYADMDVKDRNQDVVQELSKLFIDEINKELGSLIKK